jgi:hypothetical protein
MFDPQNIDAISRYEADDLKLLPKAENDRIEFKSSRTRDEALQKKIQQAASGFWNSGGGLLVVGVNDKTGRADGGIILTVGNQTRRDWIDQVISAVTPQAEYRIQIIEGDADKHGIDAGKAVILIAFAQSDAGPHMAADKSYYIRAGAHTVPASHFMVESLWSRRYFAKPKIVHVFDTEPFTGESSYLNIELVSITTAPALDVNVTLRSRLNDMPDPKLSFPLKTTLIDQSHSFGFRFEFPVRNFLFDLEVCYKDLAGKEYKDEACISSSDIVPYDNRRQNQINELLDTLNAIKRSLWRR